MELKQMMQEAIRTDLLTTRPLPFCIACGSPDRQLVNPGERGAWQVPVPRLDAEGKIVGQRRIQGPRWTLPVCGRCVGQADMKGRTWHLCLDCGVAKLAPKGWKVLPYGVAPCKRHSGASDVPKQKCHGCKRIKDMDASYNISNMLRFYCDDCMDEGDVKVCASPRCDHRVCRGDKKTSRLIKSAVTGKKRRFCNWCSVDDYPVAGPLEPEHLWDYSPQCQCNTCAFFRKVQPQRYRKVYLTPGPQGVCDLCAIRVPKRQLTETIVANDDDPHGLQTVGYHIAVNEPTYLKLCHTCNHDQLRSLGLAPWRSKLAKALGAGFDQVLNVTLPACSDCGHEYMLQDMFYQIAPRKWVSAKGSIRALGSLLDKRFVCGPCLSRNPDLWYCGVKCMAFFAPGKACGCDLTFKYNYKVGDDVLPFLVGEGEQIRPDHTPYLGIELEVEIDLKKHVGRRDGAELVRTLASDYAYCVHDGSLQPDKKGLRGFGGFEIVTFPLSLLWLKQNKLRVETLLGTLSANGFRSWEGGRCGMHVNISRKPMREGHQYRFINFIYGSTNLSMAVGQRRYRDPTLAEFAPFHTEDRAQFRDKIRANHNPGVQGHYAAVNTLKAATLECRFFRGTLNMNSFMKNLEYIYAVYEFTRKFGFMTANEANFIQWLQGDIERHTYPALHEYLTSHYIARPRSR